MRTAAILAALAATSSLALADVLCNSEILHYKSRMISASEREGFANIIVRSATTPLRSLSDSHSSRSYSFLHRGQGKAINPKATTPKPGNRKDPKKPKDKAPRKPLAGKTCSLKPGNGNGTGKGSSNNGKKRPTKVVRDLNSRLLRRAASEGKKSSDYGSDCDFEAMTDGGACGLDTWRGFKLVEGNTIDHQALVGIAESAWNEVKSK